MKTVSQIVLDTQALMEGVVEKLDQGKVQEAMDALETCGQSGRVVQNAKAVCLMRLRRYEQAVIAMRELVFPRGSFTIPEETPTAFRVNYVTALLLAGNVVTGLDMLGKITNHDDPGVKQLRAGVAKWKRGMGLLMRMAMLIGVTPKAPFVVDYPPGVLFVPWREETPRPAQQVA